MPYHRITLLIAALVSGSAHAQCCSPGNPSSGSQLLGTGGTGTLRAMVQEQFALVFLAPESAPGFSPMHTGPRQSPHLGHVFGAPASKQAGAFLCASGRGDTLRVEVLPMRYRKGHGSGPWAWMNREMSLRTEAFPRLGAATALMMPKWVIPG